MATAYPITGATLFAMQQAPGPFLRGGNLYVVALSDATLAAGRIGLFKSTDAGLTWAQVGSELELSTTTLPGAEQLYLGCCAGISEQYAYVAYLGAADRLYVSRADLDADDFDETSDAGPVVSAGTGQPQVNRLTIAQATSGGFGLLVAVSSRSIVDSSQFRVSTISLSEDLGTWGTLTDVPGQSDPLDSYEPVGACRGVDGRVHGFFVELTTSGRQICHTVVVGDGSGSFTRIGSSLDATQVEVRAGVAAAIDGTIGVLRADTAAGVGGPWYKMVLTSAASGSAPSFSTADIDATARLSPLFAAAAIGTASTVRAIYQGFADTNVYNSENGDVVLDPGEYVGAIGGYAQGFCYSTDAGLWYVPYAGGFTITGVSGIESGEMFGRTHGVGGGGEPPQCGPGTPVLPAECGTSNPTIPLPPGEQNECGSSLGYAY